MNWHAAMNKNKQLTFQEKTTNVLRVFTCVGGILQPF